MAAQSFSERLRALFRRHLVVAMVGIQQALPDRSRRSLFRDLSALGSLSSYNHAGRYYTLPEIPQFDDDGLWMHQGVLFSRHGTLKATVENMVEQANEGQTHQELQTRLRVRVHNTLLDLVQEQRIGREPLAGQYLYISRDPTRGTAQVARRKEKDVHLVATSETPAASAVIETLLEVIHGTDVQLDAAAVASRLRGRGIGMTVKQVQAVFERYALVKKTASSRSRRSRPSGGR